MNPVLKAYLQEAGVAVPKTEYRFDRNRRWRLDYAWPDQLLALEVEGGVWTKGRHTRPSGFLNDMEKYNAAAILGWRVLRCTPQTLLTMSTINLIKQAQEWEQLRKDTRR